MALPPGLFGLAMACSLGAEHDRGPTLSRTIWPVLPFLAIAAFLVYVGLTILFNRARFRVRDGVLTVRHRPLPWFGARVEMASITGLDVRTRFGRDGLANYELVALRREGEPTVLLQPPCVSFSYTDLAAEAGELARWLGVPLR